MATRWHKSTSIYFLMNSFSVTSYTHKKGWQMNSTGHKYHSTISAFFKTLLEQLKLIINYKLYYCISGTDTDLRKTYLNPAKDLFINS